MRLQTLLVFSAAFLASSTLALLDEDHRFDSGELEAADTAVTEESAPSSGEDRNLFASFWWNGGGGISHNGGKKGSKINKGISSIKKIKNAADNKRLGCVATQKKLKGPKGSISYSEIQACRRRRRMMRITIRRQMMKAAAAMRMNHPVVMMVPPRPTANMNVRPTVNMNMTPVRKPVRRPTPVAKKCCRDSSMNAYGMFSGQLDDEVDVTIFYAPRGLRVVYSEGCGNEDADTITDITVETNELIWIEQFDFNLNSTCVEGQNATLTKQGPTYRFDSILGSTPNLVFECIRQC